MPLPPSRCAARLSRRALLRRAFHCFSQAVFPYFMLLRGDAFDALSLAYCHFRLFVFPRRAYYHC